MVLWADEHDIRSIEWTECHVDPALLGNQLAKMLSDALSGEEDWNEWS